MKVGVVIVCAGAGRRLGRPKASFLLKGKPLFCYSLKVFLEINKIKQIVLVLQKKHFKFAQKYIKSNKVILAEGDRERRGSVARGLDKIKEELDSVLIHDCARPFIKKKMVLSIIKNLEKYPAVVPGLRMADTLKEVKAEIVKKTLRRDNIFLVQTPQGFRVPLIKKIYKKNKACQAVDSAQLAEEAGEPVKLIEGDRLNFKITYPQDIYIARKILA